MKTTIIALPCAIASAACAGSNNPRAQDPTSASAQSPADPTSSSTSSFGSGSTGTATTGTTGSTAPGANGAMSMMGNGSNPPVTTPAPVTTPEPATAPATGSSVTTNPGAGDHTGSADNTKLNARDRSSTLTPINQGNSKAEIGITAAIRRGVMSDHSLSFTAKNVKIITVGTKVTLRGPVKSDAERNVIENLARQAAGVTDVDDQLEVKN